MKNGIKNLYLLITAMIWGFAFVAQSKAMDSIGPFAFLFLRTILGFLFLLILGIISKQFKNINLKVLFKDGFICGVVLFSASILQQIGLIYTPASRGGFITVMYIVLVPIISVFVGKKVSVKNWLCVGLSLIGLYMLCMKGEFKLELGDACIILSALLFSVHIMVIDKYSIKYSALVLSCAQYFAMCLVGILPALFVDGMPLVQVKEAGISILYAGILSTGVGYTLQTAGQKDNNPTIASLIMSLESVFAAIGGFLILHESMSQREIIGSILIFSAIILVQIEPKKKLTKQA